MINQTEKFAHAYFYAKQVILKNGYANEIDWQDSISFSKITTDAFLKEAAWVILASGMADYVVRSKFSDLSSIFFSWNISQISKNRDSCRKNALQIFNSDKKINAILEVSEFINSTGIDIIKQDLLANGVDYLEQLPFIGPATKFHLAKNIGLPVAKPDRHLLRIAKLLNYDSPNELCEEISEYISENISVVDLVIWRYATINKNYLKTLSNYIQKHN